MKHKMEVIMIQAVLNLSNAARIMRNPNASKEEKRIAARTLGRRGGEKSGMVRQRKH
jgi:hypothetical protein